MWMDQDAGGWSGSAKLFPRSQQFTEHGEGGVVNANASSKSFRTGSGNIEGQAELVTRETGEPDQEGPGRRLEEGRRGGSMSQQGSTAAETLGTAGRFSRRDTPR